MHELSIVQSVVTSVTEAFQGQSIKKVKSVKLRIGALSGVVEDALQFSYGIATEGTLLAGSRLDVERLPVVIYCPKCCATSELQGVQSFRCAHCNTPSADIRQGRELEIESVEIQEAD